MSLRRFSAALVMVALLTAAPALAQQRDASLPRLSPNASASFTLGVTEIEVHYGAPSARGRTIYGDLVPYGQVWRMGANEATTISFSTDVTVEGEPLSAGTYGLFAIPDEDEWTFIFNRVPQQWGAYQYDPEQDALRVTVPAEQAPFQETLTVTFDNLSVGQGADAVDVVVHWADMRAAFTVGTDTDVNVEALGDQAMADEDWRRPLSYARYALQSGRHIDKALSWADAAATREESYTTLSTKARLQAANGDYAGAVQTAERALALAAALAEPPSDLEALRTEVNEWRNQG